MPAQPGRMIMDPLDRPPHPSSSWASPAAARQRSAISLASELDCPFWGAVRAVNEFATVRQISLSPRTYFDNGACRLDQEMAEIFAAHLEAIVG
jgi:hypothetical protein